MLPMQLQAATRQSGRSDDRQMRHSGGSPASAPVRCRCSTLRLARVTASAGAAAGAVDASKAGGDVDALHELPAALESTALQLLTLAPSSRDADALLLRKPRPLVLGAGPSGAPLLSAGKAAAAALRGAPLLVPAVPLAPADSQGSVISRSAGALPGAPSALGAAPAPSPLQQALLHRLAGMGAAVSAAGHRSAAAQMAALLCGPTQQLRWNTAKPQYSRRTAEQ